MKTKLFALCGLALFNSTAFSCTDFSLVAEDKSVLVTRTMEFATDLKSHLRSSNRGRQFNEITSDGKPALTWKAKYGYVFLDGLNTDAAIDGVNEKGLSVEALYLPGDTQYPSVGTDASHALPYIHFGDWILSNYQSIDEVRASLESITVFGTVLPGLGEMIFPLHFAVYDSTGKGLVIEFIDGKMKVYNNTLGIMTNSPNYDWQLVNLRNYVSLSPYNPDPVKDNGIIFNVTGQGSGMKGLPGDASPPSRFVKMSVLKQTNYPIITIQDALVVAQHMINTVDIPFGFVRAKNNEQTDVDYTQWTVFKDLTNKQFYYRTYGDSAIRRVDLSKVDFSEQASRLDMPLLSNQSVIDMNEQFLKSVSK